MSVKKEDTTSMQELRRYQSYGRTATKLNIPLEIYIAKGTRGLRFCYKCHRWKRRDKFLEYTYTTTYYTGLCIKCRGKPLRPKNIEAKFWGPAIQAARKLNILPEEYLARKARGERWCFSHQGWFDANNILNSTKYQGGTIQRCRDCLRIGSKEARSKAGEE